MTTPEHSQEEPAAALLTAPATLQLTTPAALSEGLRLLGLAWKPEPWDTGIGDTTPGMYAWVIPAQPDDLLHCPAVYLGIGAGAGGWRARVHAEEGWRSGDHAHGIAIRMTYHLGDTGAPVNSTHGGAWNNNSGQDWAGYAAARKMRMRRGGDID